VGLAEQSMVLGHISKRIADFRIKQKKAIAVYTKNIVTSRFATDSCMPMCLLAGSRDELIISTQSVQNQSKCTVVRHVLEEVATISDLTLISVQGRFGPSMMTKYRYIGTLTT
jgi:hypothetical protein